MKIRSLIATALISGLVRVVEFQAKRHPVGKRRKPAAEVELAATPLLAEDVDGPAPDATEVVEAAKAYDQAKAAGNAAERIKRKARKVLDRTPDGDYDTLTISRHESSRQVADLDAIRQIFKTHGLGDVPMKSCAPSIRFEWAADVAQPIAA